MRNQMISHFRDIHVHAATIQHWNQDYSQLTAGSAESSLTQLTTSSCHVFLEQINQRVVQSGEAPRDKMCFALPTLVPGSIRMQGRDVVDSSLFFLEGGEEFMFHMPQGMELLSIAIDRELFEASLEQVASAKELRQLLRQPVIRVLPQRYMQARSRLLKAFSAVLAHEDLASLPVCHAALEQTMLDELLQLMIDPACDKQQRSTTSTRSYIVEKCHRTALNEMSEAPSVIELCQRLQVSRRTLQNSFQAVAETTPLNYLRSMRLNGVRRTLMSTRTAELSIGDAAARWGFYHLSHFAAEYHELFAELPSQTQRATLAIRKRA